jgi:hypothetical protein
MKDILDYITSSPAEWNAKMRSGVASKSIGGKRAISVDDLIGPNMGRGSKPVTEDRLESRKVPTRVRETTTVREEVPAASGNFGSVQPGVDGIGPNMGAVNPSQGMTETPPSQGGLSAANAQGLESSAPARRSFDDMDAMDKARSIMGGGRPEGFKKGGKIASKKSAPSRTSASKRGDGCATKGHTRGKYL